MLSSRPGRDAEGLILLEGTHLLQELLWIGGQPTELIATEAWFDRHADLIQALDASVVWRRVTEAVLGAALSTVTPDGVACLCPITAAAGAAQSL
jgi:TrmH family RNA methyltransferase